MTDDCFVYVIAIEGQDISKVGISTDPEKRLKQLVTGSPFKMSIFHAFRTPSREYARMLEESFHQVQRDKRTRGEWFSMPAQEATSLMILNLISFFITHLEVPNDEVAGYLEGVGMPDGFWALVDASQETLQ